LNRILAAKEDSENSEDDSKDFENLEDSEVFLSEIRFNYRALQDEKDHFNKDL
jgi:hypothetical protein